MRESGRGARGSGRATGGGLDPACILGTPPVDLQAGLRIGASREGRPIRAFQFGAGPLRVSLLGGCHADEPVGPALLRRLCGWLGGLAPDHPMLERFKWWIVPHVNPDGEVRNRSWQARGLRFELGEYLTHVVRELPGDDIEFGFPRAVRAAPDGRDADVAQEAGGSRGSSGRTDPGPRPENRAAFEWWASADGAFDLHVSLHGMGFSSGPWFLIDPHWIERTGPLRARCAAVVRGMGYRLHDVEREGEKGFVRIARGFCTRPNHNAMREHFLGLGDSATAGRFRPSSMEAVRSLGGDALTLVTEMPLFITPGAGETIGPPDPVAARWKARVDGWKAELMGGRVAPEDVTREGARLGIRPMPVEHQMKLQWALVEAGLETVAGGVGVMARGADGGVPRTCGIGACA